LTPNFKKKKKKKKECFYNLTDYEKWKKKGKKGYKVKYYKGLGTSTTKEAKEYFRDLKIVNYIQKDDCNESIDKAFNKKRANDRKVWLQNFDKFKVLDSNETKVTFEDFIEKDLIHFSNDDLHRSIPSLLDGLKPSQRKILYACFKRNLVSEIKVAQLSGYVSEHSGYHHGEASLQGAIIGLAQDYVGSNNLNLLKPNGQFGGRILGGKDSASSRYIFTELCAYTKKIYRPEDLDLLNYLDDDGYKIEPEFYIPIIPMVLVNTVTGIGTGYSTDIPNYNPKDIINYIENKLKNINTNKVHPYYNNFKGTILINKTTLINTINEPISYLTKGIYKRINATKVEITELPIGTWTENYKLFLESLLIDKSNPNKKQILRSFDDNSTESEIHFTLRFSAVVLMKLLKKINKDDNVDNFEKQFKLTSKLNLTNMHLYNKKGIITKYNVVEDIINEFYDVRLLLYKIRKEYILERIKKDLELISYKVKFIKEIINDTLDLRKKSKNTIEKILKSKEYPELTTKIVIKPKTIDKYIHNIKQKIIINKDKLSFDYLIKMPLDTLTEEKIKELENSENKKKIEYNKLNELKIDKIYLNELKELKKCLN